jgi:hypothetical protein
MPLAISLGRLAIFMPTNNEEFQAQARRILDAIAFTAFEECQPLIREFQSIPARPGIIVMLLQFKCATAYQQTPKGQMIWHTVTLL